MVFPRVLRAPKLLSNSNFGSNPYYLTWQRLACERLDYLKVGELYKEAGVA